MQIKIGKYTLTISLEDTSVEREILEMLKANHTWHGRLEAIKRLRHIKNADLGTDYEDPRWFGLRDAKDFVDNLCRKYFGLEL